MSYLGRTQLKASDIKIYTATSSTSATHTLTWTPPNEQSLIVTINGISQHEDAYSVATNVVTLTSALIATDKLQIIGIQDIGQTTVPGTGTVSTDKIQDDAVTADKLANSINTEITANTAKVTNATHTGDVTGATALTISAGAVDLPMLSASGTASSSTFLRGDNSWAAAGGGKVLQVVTATYSTNTAFSSTSYATSGLSCSITPASTSNKVLALYSGMCRTYDNAGNSGRWVSVRLYRVTDTTQLTEQTTNQVSQDSDNEHGFCWSQVFSYLDSPSTSSAVEYRIDGKVLNSNMRLAMQNEGSTSTLTLLEIEG